MRPEVNDVVTEDWTPYLRQLNRSEIDLEDRQLAPGVVVLCNPLAPHEFLKDSTANRGRFCANDFVWTNATRMRLWFGSDLAVPVSLAAKFRQAEAAKQAFVGALSENLEDEKDGIRGRPFPSIREPLWYAMLPWEPAVKRVELATDLTAAFVNRLTQQAGVPCGLRWPDAWTIALRAVNHLVVYRLTTLGAQVDVVVAFLTPLAATAPAVFDIATPDAKCITAIQKVYGRWSASGGSGGANFVYFTLGADSPWDQAVQSVTSGRHWIMCSSRAADGRWQHMAPPRYGDRLSLSNFLDRLKPETRKQRTARIKDFVDDQFADPSQIVDIELVKRRLGYRRTLTLEAFEDMQNRSGYHVYKTKAIAGIPDGLVAIRQTVGTGDFRLRPFIAAPHTVWQVSISFLIIIAPQTLGAMFNWTMFGTRVQLSTLVFSVVTAYLTSLIIRYLTRLKNDKE